MLISSFKLYINKICIILTSNFIIYKPNLDVKWIQLYYVGFGFNFGNFVNNQNYSFNLIKLYIRILTNSNMRRRFFNYINCGTRITDASLMKLK